MNLGIVTIAYNNYGLFLPQWAESVAGLTIPPTTTTVILGKKHGLTSALRAKTLSYLPSLQIVEDRQPQPKMGYLRNVAVRSTNTEWIQYLSVDDIILPWAVEEYKKFKDEADFISIRWKSIATWDPNAEEKEHLPRIPYEMAKNVGGRGFVNNQSPYRRSFWARSPYMEHDYPNAPFVAGLVELGARFVKTERPCTVYLRRLDSHCGRNLGRRQIDGKRTVVGAERRQARYWKLDMEQRIRAYYEEK